MKEKKSRRIPFRTILWLFAGIIVFSIGIPILVIEVQKPWQELDNLVDKGKIIVVNSQKSFDQTELEIMNQTAIAMNMAIDANPELHNEQYLTWTFNMMIIEGKLLDKKTVMEKLSENKVIVSEFDYDKIVKTYNFWEGMFEWDKDPIELFAKYKKLLISFRDNNNIAGFEFDDTYVMVDDGKKLMFLIDGGDEWWDSTYPGQEYDVIENDTPYFRDYLEKGPGFGNNPRHAKIMPKFDTDDWGSWFSVWYSVKQESGVYNNFPIDFDASKVKDMMRRIIILSIIFTLILIVFLAPIIHKITQRISQPVKDLVSATEEIAEGNFDFEVPVSGSSDFEHLINVFNGMIKKLKERLNMKETLQKLLSDELADQVAKEGLVLGGQNIDATIMFTDFGGFSTITQNMEPKIVVKMLNHYFSELIPIIKKWGGFPDKFIGDAIVAIFGAPVPLKNHAESAISCAIEMQLKMRQINDLRKANNQPRFEMRIGLNSGDVLVGAIGSNLKLEYTTIGETTNLANRMEASCEIGHILIAQGTYERVASIFFEGVDFDEDSSEFEVKGYSEPVHAYNIYVANIEIQKDNQAKDIRDFYIINESDKNLKFEMDLDENEKSKFSKFVTIKLPSED